MRIRNGAALLDHIQADDLHLTLTKGHHSYSTPPCLDVFNKTEAF